ncbi:unnamed protein product [Schistosoma curassoni]|uniref:Uncharacterized protein n=1 Tax=Schistosoma curassoni TaxID=6186 RepID=A0A183L361_9TREM|nr:unnamed protein product [Schistosoma curassoni]
MATSLAQRLQKDLEEERALNRSLLINEKTWRERTEQAESEAKTARAECRELLLNLELRDKLNELNTNKEVISLSLSLYIYIYIYIYI